MDKLLNLKQVAEILGKSSGVVRTNYVKTGKLKAVKIGGWRFREEDVREFIDRGLDK